MIFDVRQFVLDYHISFREYGKNWQKGWLQIRCPFSSCGDTGYHGGLNIRGGYYNCWRCGRHSINDFIQSLIRIDFMESKKLIRRYQTILDDGSDQKEIVQASTIDFPTDCSELSSRHEKYLLSRDFDPDLIKMKWGVKGTGPVGAYKLRIIIPIFLNGVMVSYQGRDVTGQADLRYKACPLDKEIINHKSILYGIDHVKESCVVVEGITDTWRLGFGAVALFGVEYNAKQLNLLASRVKRAVVLLDTGMNTRAEELAADIGVLGVETEILELDEGDPGELSEEDARYIMKNYL